MRKNLGKVLSMFRDKALYKSTFSPYVYFTLPSYLITLDLHNERISYDLLFLTSEVFTV